MTALTKLSTVIIVGVAASLAMIFFLLLPSLNKLDNANQTLMNKKTEVANLDQQIRAYQTAESDLNRVTNKDSIYDAILPKEQLVEAVKGIESGAGKTKSVEALKITDPFVKVDPASAPAEKVQPQVKGLTGITEVPYRITLTSDYSGLTDFMSYLEHLPNFTEISKFQLSAEIVDSGSSKPAHTGKVDSNIDGVFFVK